MNKYLIITILLFILIVSNTSAQNSIGIKGGISIPNLSAGSSVQNPLNSGYSSRLGPDFAIFHDLEISKIFSLVSQLEYSSQGGKKDGLQAFPFPPEFAQFFPPGQAPKYLYADYKSEAKLNYFMLGELAKFNWHLGNSNCSFYFDGGPFAALLISAHQVTSGSSVIYADEQMQQPLTPDAQSFDNKEDIKDSLHTGNFGVEADLGLSFSFGNSKIFIEGGGNYGFINIQKGSENGKNNTGAATVRIGYAVSFGKNGGQ